MSRDQFLAHFASEPRVAARVSAITFPENGCWLWPGAMTTYPQCYGGKPIIRVHRKSLEIKIGKPLGDLIARHDCDTPPCVNPMHLRPGTVVDNVRDKVERGRMNFANQVRGFKHRCATVTDAQIVEALLLLDSGVGPTAVGRKYGVTPSTVRCWRRGEQRREAHDAWLAARESAVSPDAFARLLAEAVAAA